MCGALVQINWFPDRMHQRRHFYCCDGYEHGFFKAVVRRSQPKFCSARIRVELIILSCFEFKLSLICIYKGIFAQFTLKFNLRIKY